MMKIYLSFLILVLLAVGSVNTRAVEVGSDVKIGASATSAIDPQIVYCSVEDTFLLAWTNDSVGYSQIYYNLAAKGDLGSTGVRLSAPYSTGFLFAEKPQLAYDASTGIAGVVYTESFAYHKDKIMLSFVDVSTGIKTGSFEVGTANSWNMSGTIATDNNGTFLVAYYDTIGNNISAKFFNSAGVQQGTTKIIGTVPSGYLLPFSIDIAYNSVDDNFLVVWADFAQTLKSITIDKTGTIGTVINYASFSNVANPAVAYNPVNNEFFVTFDNYAGVVKGQLLDNVGGLMATTFTFGNAKLESNPDVFYNSNKGAFAITWQQYLDSAGIWMQEYKSHDCPFLYDSVKISNVSLTANAPAIAFDSNAGNYWTVWYGDSGGKDEIYLQQYESDVYLVKAICQDVTVYLDAEGKAVITENDIDGGSTAICGPPVLTASRDTLTCSDVSSVTVDLIATDILGRKDTCTATVTVLDTISPTAVCQNITVCLDGTGAALITAAEINNGSSDNCGLGTLTASQTAFDCTDVGDVTVTLTVPDVNGNSKTCTSTVTVQDTISPTAVCQNITVYLDGTGAASITAADIDNGSTDNCQLGTITASQTDFDCTDVGDVTVTLTVPDVNGNSKICTSTVTVQDTISPTAVCQNITVYLDGTGAASITAAEINNGSSDNCGLGTLTASQTAFDCTDVGDVTVTLTVPDVNGNSKICTSTVTVQDTISPTAVCQNITVCLDGTGAALITAAEINNGSSDNCGLGTLTASQTAFDCTDVGDVTVTLTVPDVNGNSKTCTSTVTVADTISPTAVCQNITVYLDGTGAASITAADIDNGSTDNCQLGTITASQTDFDCTDVGDVTVTLTVPDVNGNSKTCTSTVTVADTISPTAVCQNITVYLDGTGAASITTADINNGSTDNCGLGTLTASQTAFDCSDVGDVTVTLTVPDVNGNSKTCTSTVTVADTISPTAVCQNITVYLDGTGAASITTADINNGSTDNCGLGTLTASQTAFDCTDVGDVTVTLTVPDVNGNSKTCTSTVTVTDTISPTAICQNITVYLDGTGAASITTADINNGSTDNCQLGTITASQTAFDCTDVGDVTVTLTVPDVNGNSKTCTSTVTVQDTISPTAVCQNITVYLDGTGTASITAADINNGSTDNCALGTITASQTDFDCTDIGDVTVTLTVPDVNGNSKTCTSTVTVTDTISPTAVCQNITVYLDGTGAALITAADINNGSTDNCELGTITASQTAFDCTDVGDVAVTLTVPDVNGNSKTCTSTVTVQDTISPTAVCKNITVYLDGTGAASITAADINNGSTDNCELGTITASQTAFDCTDVGDVTVTLTVPDVNGNSKTCTSTVTVQDTISPTALCQNITVYLDGTGAASITTADINNGSTDNCTLGTITASQTDFDCTDVGDVTVILTVPDVNGNSTTCTSTVTVADTLAPVVICQDVIVIIDSSGTATVSALEVDNGSTDNCEIDTLILSQTIFNDQQVGENIVTLTAFDVSGNSSTCESKITVEPNVPKMVCNPIQIYLDEDGEYQLVKTDIDLLSAGTTDATTPYEDLIIEVYPDTFTCANIQWPVFTRVTAYNKFHLYSRCWAPVTVIDTFVFSADPIDDIEVVITDGACETKIEYPELTAASACATFTQVGGLGSNGMFPIGTTIEKWILTNTSEDTVEVSFKVTVVAQNDLPAVNQVSDVKINQGVSTLQIPLTGISSGNDCQVQSLTVTATGVNAALISTIGVNYVSPDATGSLTAMLVPGASGTDTITVKVADSGGDFVTDTFVIVVNAPPTINPVADVEADEDTPVVTVSLSGISSGSVTEMQTISVNAVHTNAALVAGVNVNYTSPGATGSLDIAIHPNKFGTDTISIVVSDGEASVTETFVLKVNHVNHPPVVVNPVADQVVNASYILKVPVNSQALPVFNDVDGDLLLFSILVDDKPGLPAWMSVVNDTLILAPAIADTGCVEIVVMASDPSGEMAMDTFQLCVDGYPTGITDNTASVFDVQMYPNPSKGEVNLEIRSSVTDDSEVIVRSITGSEVFRKEYKAAENIKIDLSEQVSGIYLVTLQMGNQSVVKKLILDRK